VTSDGKPQPDGGDSMPFDRYLFFWFGHVDALYRHRVRQLLKALGISLPLWRALASLHAAQPCTVSELAEITVIERTALARVLAQAETDGLIAREEDETDRRRMRLRLTEKGNEAHARARGVVHAYYMGILGDTPEEEVDQAVAFMRRLVRNMGGSGHHLSFAQRGEASQQDT